MLLAFSIGALLASVWPTLLLCLGALALLPVFRYSQYLKVSLAALAGIVWVNFHVLEAQQTQLPLEQGRQNWIVTGQISDLIRQGNRLQLDLQGQGPYGRLRLSCYQCSLDIKVGQRWQLAVRLKPFVNFNNPGGFDYRRWMMSKGYGARGHIVQPHQHNQMLVNSVVSPHQKITEMFDVHALPFLQALLLGDKHGLAVEDKRFIFQSGIAHLFVVSGLHLGIVAFSIYLLCQLLQRSLLAWGWRYSQLISSIAAATGVIFYGWMSGFEVPAVRACLMVLLGMFIWMQGGLSSPFRYWQLVLAAVLILQPLAFLEMGAWLSFFIVLALIVGFYQGQKRGPLLGLLKAQYLAFLLGSIVLLSFQRELAPMGFLLNLVLIPLFSLMVVPLAFLSLLSALMGMPEGLLLLEAALQALFALLKDFAGWFTWVAPIHESNRMLILLLLVFLLLIRNVMLKLSCLLPVLFILFMPHDKPAIGGFRVSVLDVGQGNSALIETAEHAVLVDTGNAFPGGLSMVDFVVRSYLIRRNIRRLDLLHLTHDDVDHAGGLQQLLAISNRISRQNHCEHKQWLWDGVVFQQFQADGFSDGNNGSCLLRVQAADGEAILFTGDIERPAERALIRSHGELVKAEVLMVPHHGSNSSSGRKFVQAVAPRMALISAGYLNRYGHPHPQVLSRYREIGTKIVSTSTQGAIEVDFPPRQAAHIVSTYRPDFAL